MHGPSGSLFSRVDVLKARKNVFHLNLKNQHLTMREIAIGIRNEKKCLATEFDKT